MEAGTAYRNGSDTHANGRATGNGVQHAPPRIHVVPAPPRVSAFDLMPVSPVVLLACVALGIFAFGFMFGFVARGSGAAPQVTVVPGSAPAAGQTPAAVTPSTTPPAAPTAEQSTPATEPPPAATTPAKTPPASTPTTEAPAADSTAPTSGADETVTLEDNGLPAPVTPPGG